jgi:eukaryotic-like serine/threonine-protein kinase
MTGPEATTLVLSALTDDWGKGSNRMYEQWGKKYKLKNMIARGGMAEIFAAEMLGPAGFVKPVCLKRVLPEFSANQEFVRMFEAEARIAATLQHQNIVQVFDFDEHDGRLFLVLEFVDGLDLRHVLKFAKEMKLRVSVQFAVHVLKGLLAALSHAHEAQADGQPRPVIHRDVSPHNIIVATTGSVKLADFGIAKARGLSDETQTGVIKGKLAYLSPEQAVGQTVGPLSDLFCVGLVMREMLAGRRLFGGSTDSEIVAQVMNVNAEPIAGIDDGLNDFVCRLLAKNPASRYPSARAALEALGELGIAGCGDEAAGQMVAAIISMKKAMVVADEAEAAQRQAAEDERKAGIIESAEPTRLSASEIPVPPEKPLVRKTHRLFVSAAVVLGMVIVVLILGNWKGRQPATPITAAISTDELPTKKAGGLVVTTAPVVTLKQPLTVESPPVLSQSKKHETTSDGNEKRDTGDVKDSVAGMGILQVYVRPWARVLVDGVEKGTTPLDNMRLKAGSHRVTLINDEIGYRRAFPVQIKPGKKKTFRKSIDE